MVLAEEESMLIIGHSQVRDLLPLRSCMHVVAEALADLARGEGVQPLRDGFLLPARQGVLAWMPGSLAAEKPFGIKVLSVIGKASEMGLDSHQGGVMIFDPIEGRPLALVEAGAITAVRTAAVSAVATDLLARKEASRLAILGSGTQARSHIEAMLAVRPIQNIRIWNRTPKHAKELAERQSTAHSIPVEVATSVEMAVKNADIVCTTTSSKDPILSGTLLEPGMHVNAVGASIPSCRELDGEVLRRATLFTDRRESLATEAGEYIAALEMGVIKVDDEVAEIGELLVGKREGRASSREITVFRSLGLAVEDVAAAHLVYANAVERGVGTQVDFSN
jgi:ornithine cyclodeaminase